MNSIQRLLLHVNALNIKGDVFKSPAINFLNSSEVRCVFLRDLDLRTLFIRRVLFKIAKI